MRYKKILLVSPKFYMGKNRLSLHPPVGLGYIAEALVRNDFCVEILDMNLGYNFRHLKLKINEFKPDIIGFTAMTLGYVYFYELLNKIKEIYPQIKIAVGGAHVSALREKTLQECLAIDYGIIIEGDNSFVKLCLGEELNRIDGLIYRKDGQIITNAFNNFIENLDEINFPKYELFELNKYPTKQVGIVTSRGCPYRCIYCSVISTSGNKFRARSAQNITNEIFYWYEKGYRHIYILDDNFTLIPRRVEEVCELIKKMGLKGLHLKCPNGIRADRVNYNILKNMKEAGFDMVAFGVEASSNKILRNLKKDETIEEMEKSIEDACSLGFDVDLFFLIGSPEETTSDVEQSFKFAQKFPLRRAIFYNLIPLPATELLGWLNDKKYLTYPLNAILNNASYYNNNPCFFTPEMSISDRKKAVKKGSDVLLKIRRKHIERKIKGPFFFRKIFSFIYTLPMVDEAIINNPYVVKLKEKIKSILLG